MVDEQDQTWLMLPIWFDVVTSNQQRQDTGGSSARCNWDLPSGNLT